MGNTVSSGVWSSSRAPGLLGPPRSSQKTAGLCSAWIKHKVLWSWAFQVQYMGGMKWKSGPLPPPCPFSPLCSRVLTATCRGGGLGIPPQRKWLCTVKSAWMWRPPGDKTYSLEGHFQCPSYSLCLKHKQALGITRHLRYSCLENPMDGGAWWAAVHGVAESRTWLSDFTFTFHFHALEKEMATHSSVLAWRIPGTGEPGGRLSLGSHRVGHDWSDAAAAAAYHIYILCYSLDSSLKTKDHCHLE